MASLIDKLRAAQPQKQAPRPKAEDCLIKVTRYPCHTFPLKAIEASILRMMTGTHIEEALQPERLLFLDTETTGLQGGAGTLAFLIGLGVFRGDEFVVTQYLMRDYDEEPFVLTPVLERMRQAQALITFNGAAFDMPLLDSRFTMNRMRVKDSLSQHIDLLHIARRVYKMRLQKCSLQRLESEVFGLPRADDLPGALVPERYFQYLKTREIALLDDILEHNALDIVSLARLLYALAGLHEQPLSAEDQRDLFSLGRVYEKRGEKERAAVCYRACDGASVKELAQLRLADMMRRSGEHQQAVTAYEALQLSGKGGAKVFIALAKLYEHRFHQPARALAIARQGMLYCLERFGNEAVISLDYENLQHRVARLLKKTGGR
jgi:uncharacterized protein YprB with RNaseH-like and TPR domain